MSMRAVYGVVVVAAFVVVLSIVQSCGVFNSACSETMPTVTTGQVLVEDARRSVEMARQVITVQGQGFDNFDKAIKALKTADDALGAVSKSLAVAVTACETLDLRSTFGAFIEAWKSLAPFLALVGTAGTGSTIDPVVVQVYK